MQLLEINKKEEIEFEIVRYKEEYKSTWNQFINTSKNGSFLFNRNYMEYHSDRFEDHSLMCFDKGKLIAVLPASIRDNILSSHDGLTFGSMITNYKMRTSNMLILFDALKNYLKKEKIKKLKYITIPYIYHIIPANEDLYALHVNGAKLVKRDFISCIDFSQEKLFQSRCKSKRKVKTGLETDLIVRRSVDFEPFWNILEDLLAKKYNTKPVHTVEEIKLLADRFPDNIKHYCIYKGNELLAGTVIYESNKNILQGQYQAITEEGKHYHALDYLHNYTFDLYRSEKKYYNCGSSIIRETGLQNLDLLNFKETLGARIIPHDTYEMEIF